MRLYLLPFCLWIMDSVNDFEMNEIGVNWNWNEATLAPSPSTTEFLLSDLQGRFYMFYREKCYTDRADFQISQRARINSKLCFLEVCVCQSWIKHKILTSKRISVSNLILGFLHLTSFYVPVFLHYLEIKISHLNEWQLIGCPFFSEGESDCSPG